MGARSQYQLSSLSKTVSKYNSVVFKISSQLKLCEKNITDEDLLEKAFSTFHASNVLLQQQYREKGFEKYSNLISCLLLMEQNNEILMKNYEAHPTESAPFLKVNAAAYNKSKRRQNRNYSYRRGHGKGRNNYRYHSRNKQENNKGSQNISSKSKDNICHRCGIKDH